MPKLGDGVIHIFRKKIFTKIFFCVIINLGRLMRKNFLQKNILQDISNNFEISAHLIN